MLKCIFSKTCHCVNRPQKNDKTKIFMTNGSQMKVEAVLDLGLISIGSLGPRASTKVESHVNFTESQKVSQPNFFAILSTEKLAKTTN